MIFKRVLAWLIVSALALTVFVLFFIVMFPMGEMMALLFGVICLIVWAIEIIQGNE